MARLGLSVVNTSTATPAAPAAGPSAAANYPITPVSVAPSDTPGPSITPPPVLLDTPPAAPSSNKTLWLIGAGAGALGLVALVHHVSSSHSRS
jgi:hypothetical protein